MRSRNVFAAFTTTASSLIVACVDSNAIRTDEPNGEGEVEAGGVPKVEIDGSADLVDATAPPSRCSHEGWCEVDIPPEQDLDAVWGDGQGTLWAVGACIANPSEWVGKEHVKGDACILRWNGTAFEIAFSYPRTTRAVRLSAIWGSGPTDIWVGGSAGLFHGSGATPASLTWSRVALAGEVWVASIWGTSATDVWMTNAARTAEGRVYHYAGPSADADAAPGAAWVVDPVSSRFSAPLASSRPDLLVFGSAADDVWVTGPSDSNVNVTRFEHLTPSPHGGVAWTEVIPPDVPPSVMPTKGWSVTAGLALSPREVWFGGVLRDDKIGYPIRLTYDPSNADDAGGEPELFVFIEGPGLHFHNQIYGYWGTSSTDLWFVGEHGRVRHWDGSTWTLAFISPTQTPLLADLRGIWGPGRTAPEDLWVVGDGIALHHDTGLDPGREGGQ